MLQIIPDYVFTSWSWRSFYERLLPGNKEAQITPVPLANLRYVVRVTLGN